MAGIPRCFAVWVSRWRQNDGQAALAPDGDRPASESRKEAPGPVLKRELSLAAEHLQSVRVLLEMSRSFHMPIPPAVFQNLNLVAKHLRDLERRFGTDV